MLSAYPEGCLLGAGSFSTKPSGGFPTYPRTTRSGLGLGAGFAKVDTTERRETNIWSAAIALRGAGIEG